VDVEAYGNALDKRADMIEDESLARQVSDLMLEYGAKLDASVTAMQSQLPEEEFVKYRRAIGRVMGSMLLDVMNPVYEMHPQMRPAQLDQTGSQV